LEQVLINLLNNALDAVSGQPDAWVMVTLTDGGDRLFLDVRDSGPGIAPALRDDLFMPFATSKPGGLGLGLHIARDIMVEFGGALDLVVDELHTLFRMTLVKA
jgi:two-component system C4-dicarboxylate transport sensor histidine kinase DctB